MNDWPFHITAIGAMSLGLAASTYHAYAARKGLPVHRLFAGPGSPMSPGGSAMVFAAMAAIGLGRGPLVLLVMIAAGLLVNIALHAIAGKDIQVLSLLAPALTAATIWFSGVL